ncbi:SIR2 family protein [Microbacterium sp. F51-2R]|uniref:SIR2 family protein n=1 Tax=Microbacterium sp. F51-2R TaxID=3445777 RepID=UPI003F9EFA2F
MAQETDTPVDRGIGSWVPGRPIARSCVDGRINLHKLHGSLDWELEIDRRLTQSPEIISPESQIRGSALDPGLYTFRPRTRPWIVVGDREKLATDGPTLDLLQSAMTALRESTHLVVVGYSFSDAHINAMIRDWLASDDKRTIGILDLNWRTPGEPAFRTQLIERYGASHEAKTGSRVVPIAGTAAQALSTALTSRPEGPDPVPYLSATHKLEPDHLEVEVTLLGPDLFGASLDLHFPASATSTRRPPMPRGHDTYLSLQELRAGRTSLIPSSWHPVHVDHWRTGDAITVYCQPPTTGPVEIQVWGSRIDGRDHTSVSLEIIPSESLE